MVDESGGELLDLLPEVGVDLPELRLHHAESLELVGELEGGQDGVLGGERDQRGGGQGAVGVDAGKAGKNNKIIIINLDFFKKGGGMIGSRRKCSLYYFSEGGTKS